MNVITSFLAYALSSLSSRTFLNRVEVETRRLGSGPIALTQMASEIGTMQARALQEFFDLTRMDESPSRDQHNWVFGESLEVIEVCNFTGVACDNDGFVVALELVGSDLSGTLPDNFDQLPKLRRLHLFNNSLYGKIPDSLLHSSTLNHLNVGHNFFTGPFPDVSNLLELSRLIVDRNAFSGYLPSSLCNLQHLEALDLSSITKMAGEIPPCLGNLTKLNKFRLTDVGLTGPIPTSLCGSERDMNGFSPNFVGCDAIACRQGYYQKPAGRQTSDKSPCRVCDVPSNVIGSSSCQWQLSPSQAATKEPTSRQPITHQPITRQPTSKPTTRPSTTKPTRRPSQRPSVGSPTQLIFLTETPTLLPGPITSLPSESSPHWSQLPSSVASASPTQNHTKITDSSPTIAASDKTLNSPATGGLIVGSVAFAVLILFASALAFRKQRHRSSKLIPLEDHELLPANIEKSNDPFDKPEVAQNNLVPAVNHNPSILRTSLRQEGGKKPPSQVLSNSRRVRFDLPEAERCESSLDESALLGQSPDPQLPRNDDAWMHWVNPILDPIRLCQVPFQRSERPSLISNDSSTLDGESKSNNTTDESRDELESILGIRDRYSTDWSSWRGETPSTKHRHVADSPTDDPFTIDEGYHDIGDNELAAEHVADKMMEV